MTTALIERLEALREEIAKADDQQRAELLEHLEEAVLTLESHGAPVPTWARQRLADRIDEEIEEQFDNMPF